MSRFPFYDLHSYKDYVGFVKLCAPEYFPEREGVSAGEQWTLDLAFEGLREGLAIAKRERGALPVFEECGLLIEDALQLYREQKIKAGYLKLDEVSRRLGRVETA